jgi:hypothetical protein
MGLVDFEQVVAILEQRGYPRLSNEVGYAWEHGRSRVRLTPTSAAGPHFAYVIGRQRYEEGPDGRYLNPQSNPVPIEREATEERLADLIEDQLRSPF